MRLTMRHLLAAAAVVGTLGVGELARRGWLSRGILHLTRFNWTDALRSIGIAMLGSRHLRNVAIIAAALTFVAHKAAAVLPPALRPRGYLAPFAGFVTLFWAIFYEMNLTERPRLVFSRTPWSQSVLERLHIRRFRPVPWGVSTHVQTVVCNLINRLNESMSPSPKYQRETIPAFDGNVVCLDWATDLALKHAPPDAPIVYIEHGLAGSPEDNYCRNLVAHCVERGWRAVVHFRWRLDYAEWRDVHASVQHIAARYPDAPIVATAFSAGAHVLLSYLQALGSDTPLVGSCVVSPALDLVKMISWMETPHSATNPAYANAMESMMLSSVERHVEHDRNLDRSAVHKFESALATSRRVRCHWLYDRFLTLLPTFSGDPRRSKQEADALASARTEARETARCRQHRGTPLFATPRGREARSLFGGTPTFASLARHGAEQSGALAPLPGRRGDTASPRSGFVAGGAPGAGAKLAAGGGRGGSGAAALQAASSSHLGPSASASGKASASRLRRAGDSLVAPRPGLASGSAQRDVDVLTPVSSTSPDSHMSDAPAPAPRPGPALLGKATLPPGTAAPSGVLAAAYGRAVSSPMQPSPLATSRPTVAVAAATASAAAAAGGDGGCAGRGETGTGNDDDEGDDGDAEGAASSDDIDAVAPRSAAGSVSGHESTSVTGRVSALLGKYALAPEPLPLAMCSPFGHNTADHYSRTAGNNLDRVGVPCLVFLADDDQLMPPSFGETLRQAALANPNIVYAHTHRGGHCAWHEGLVPTGASYAEQFAVSFLAAVLAAESHTAFILDVIQRANKLPRVRSSHV
ncbi:hypothetical protein FNF31_00629 [Cafeteria roenbergensis]|uniref:Serine aminopeptidase S33 domain-containing protein n=1 Tax=Cafeteria roenbergensis TaxID=33653 RepID=A0A5A8DWP0_CAFRO|nr:hypothetical protein FNF31_00629 [Cafeteria roenbergensis]KAA0169366.1 hypothetical protein FNF28_02147 [Cafeteria roenbergensis]